jgi:hypothetical protein
MKTNFFEVLLRHLQNVCGIGKENITPFLVDCNILKFSLLKFPRLPSNHFQSSRLYRVKAVANGIERRIRTTGGIVLTPNRFSSFGISHIKSFGFEVRSISYKDIKI